MLRTRLAGHDRRSSIVAAAKTVFAELGFEGARLQHIAAAAGVSEALIYRHFDSKTALYRAVLRLLIEDQDRAFATIGGPEPSAAGLVQMLHRLLSLSLRGADAPNADGVRVLFASLAGDGSHARLAFRRASRHMRPVMAAALLAARESGELTGGEIDPTNAMSFIAQVATMMQVAHMPARPLITYAGEPTELIRQGVWFCGRGIGLTEAALSRHYPG